MIRFISFGVILFSLWTLEARAEIYPDQEQTCKLLSEMAFDVQALRRADETMNVEGAIDAYQDDKEPLRSVREAVIYKVYATVPIQVPPIAVKIDFNDHCRWMYDEINRESLKL